MKRSSHTHHGASATRNIFLAGYKKDCKDKFGYIFNYGFNETIDYTAENRALLEALGGTMLGQPANEDSTIPAGYTYLGQFIDHDIDRDATSSLDKRQDARKIQNFRSPRLDLDSVYGLGPSIQPFLYQKNSIKLLIGENKVRSTKPLFDLPRNPEGTAIIGDPRNDENLLVAQMHLAFLKFHNAVVDIERANHPNETDKAIFERAKLSVTLHYQWLVVHDFLKTITNPSIVDQVFEHGNQYFNSPKSRNSKMIMPVEFAVAAYRFGHSLVRHEYDLNEKVGTVGFDKLFSETGKSVHQDNIIDWAKFFPINPNFKANFARKLDTNLAAPLFDLPFGRGLAPIMVFLAKRNLVRGMALGVPTGQALSNRMGIPVMPEEIMINSSNPEAQKILQQNGHFLAKHTPLWYYVLKEAEVHGGEELGAVGSTILVEVFHRMLRLDPNSIVRNTSWRPTLGAKEGEFTIIDLLKVAEVV